MSKFGFRYVLAMALAVMPFAASSAPAQVPQECAEGNGSYDGSLAGDIRYYAFTNNTRKVIFIEGDAAGEFSPAAAGTEITFSDIESDGAFTASRTDSFSGNTLTFNGRYENCAVEGTWTLTYAAGGSDNGTFMMEAEAPLPVVNVGALCGSTGSAGMFFLTIAGAVKLAGRRRRRFPPGRSRSRPTSQLTPSHVR